jgi:DNA-binding PadR family transcriptional regulator
VSAFIPGNYFGNRNTSLAVFGRFSMTPFRRNDVPGLMSPVMLQVLLSLADADRHGYGIKIEIQERTAGAVSLAVGTLYETLYRLERQGAVRGRPSPSGESGGAPRRVYQLTRVGRDLLEREIARLSTLLFQARQKNVRVVRLP